MNQEKKKSFIVNVLYLGTIVAILYVIFHYLVGWLLPFLIGLVIALCLQPIIDWMNRKTKASRKFCAVFVVLFFYALFGGLLWLFGGKLIYQVGELFEKLPSIYQNNIEPFLDQLGVQVENFFTRFTPDAYQQFDQVLGAITGSLQNIISGLSTSVVAGVTKVATGLPQVFVTLVFAIIASIFISMDYYSITSFLVKQVPEKFRCFVFDTKGLLKDSIGQYLRAYCIILLITFAELWVGFLLLRIPYALALAILIAIADILPVLGTGTFLVPWGIYQLVVGNVPLGMGILILYAVITFARSMLEPKIVGNKIGLHPLVTLISSYVGLKLFGFLGLFLLPIAILILCKFQESGKLKLWKT